MARTPEYERGGEPVLPRTTRERKKAVDRQRSGPFRQYAEQFEGENNHPPTTQNNPDFPRANPVTIYRVNGLVEIKGYQFPEGVLPINAIPIGEITFFSRLLLKFGLIRQQK